MDSVKSKGRFLSLILRHKPEVINAKLDKHGWVETKILIDSGKFTIELLEEIVETNNKGRFKFNFDKSKIRALQGHSLEVDLGLKPTKPPKILYHGTSKRFVKSIINNGIQKQSREYVHLSDDKKTAKDVGKRRDQNPTILIINAELMHKEGRKFYLSENNVWLVDSVPPKYLDK